MIKYVYVLVSDETDYYLEQALMSITSLKMHMPGVFVLLLIDDITEKSLISKRRNILEHVNEFKIVNINFQYNKKARSRWLKTSMRKHIYGDFLFIDCDTIISENLGDVENFNIDLGAVLDLHVPLLNSPSKELIRNNDKLLGFYSSFALDNHFNSGVIFCRDTNMCHKFFKEWHKLWLCCLEKGILIDQPSFNQANYLIGNAITELEGKWNCQIFGTGAIEYLHEAKIIHYYTSTRGEKPYLLANQNIFEMVKETITINPKLKNMLENPKYLFPSNSRLVIIGKFNKSMIYGVARRIFDSKFSAGVELGLSIIYRFIFKPLRKFALK